ncbi:MAG TPA: N-acetyltransferase [Candidatus Dormibacteraeota bacterium]|nr:N-acetyltransferase [Candidatus Dormibacteraeota bacterium]
MTMVLRAYEPRDFAALYRIDQACYPRGIAYSKITLRWFLGLAGAECLVAEIAGESSGFILAEKHPPLAHIITIDVIEGERRNGVGSAMVKAIETNLAQHSVRFIVLETATNNEPAVAFWKKHGYRVEGVLKRYYLGRLDAYEMKKVLLPTKEI